MINPTDNRYAYVGMHIQIPSTNINGTGLMLGERVKYTGVIGQAIISTANPNLDGTGTITDLVTGAGYGTMIKRIIIKAQGSTSQGMIRLFFKSGATYRIMREIEVPSITQSGKQDTFMFAINDPFYLKPSYLLCVSTERAETFIVTAEGMQISYPA